ncbi:MAG: hypothetical protein AB7N91_00860 [Candidatus Tectimicrobiota bacterium]
MQGKMLVLVGVLGWLLLACRSLVGIFQSPGQEAAFRERYLEKPFYTAMVIHPYRYNNDEYLVDLTGKVLELEYETTRSSVVVPLGTPIHLVGLDTKHVLARVAGHTRPFRLLVQTKQGTVDEVAKELTLVLAKEPPLQFVRPEMRAFVAQQEVIRGMSRREVLMSWGQPDRVNGVPGSSGFLEEWIYYGRRVHMFLDNGTVTNWQHY